MEVKRWDIINFLIKDKGFEFYLEIGVREGRCFSQIKSLVKIGVDPKFCKGYANYNMTSDKFFSLYKAYCFDLVFIDGLHFHEQVIKDVENSLNLLNPNGIILLHDCRPLKEEMQLRKEGRGNGDVWKAFAYFRKRNNLEMFTLNTDHGIGVIKKGTQKTYDGPFNTWQDYKDNQKEILKLTPPISQIKDLSLFF